MFQIMGISKIPQDADIWSKVRERLLSTVSKLLHWDADPVSSSKPAKCIDV
jgi:hypothetical protein